MPRYATWSLIAGFLVSCSAVADAAGVPVRTERDTSFVLKSDAAAGGSNRRELTVVGPSIVGPSVAVHVQPTGILTGVVFQHVYLRESHQELRRAGDTLEILAPNATVTRVGLSSIEGALGGCHYALVAAGPGYAGTRTCPSQFEAPKPEHVRVRFPVTMKGLSDREFVAALEFLFDCAAPDGDIAVNFCRGSDER
jgi:hypothetical protein